jgi:hypothetical protein
VASHHRIWIVRFDVVFSRIYDYYKDKYFVSRDPWLVVFGGATVCVTIFACAMLLSGIALFYLVYPIGRLLGEVRSA